MSLPPVAPLPKITAFSDEWAILKLLKRWTPQDIKRAIDEDVDLADLLLRHWAGTGFLRTIARRNSYAVENVLSPDTILYWFSCRRPDLHAEIVGNPRGVPWLIRNFAKIRDILEM